MSLIDGTSRTPWRTSRAGLPGSLRKIAVILMSLLTGIVMPVVSNAQDRPTEYEIKAAFIYNFLKFTQWPDKVFTTTDAPLRVCTTPNDPFGTALNTIADKQIGAHSLHIDRQVPVKALTGCDAVFFSARDADDAMSTANIFRDRPVLTIGDAPGFARNGGMIGLTVVDGQVRFEVNPTAAQRAGLSLSSQLLKLATIVGGEQ